MIRKIIPFAFLILALLVTSASLFAANPAELDTEAVDAYIKKEMRANRIPGLALGIVKDGEIVYMQGYGNADRNRLVTPQTPFIIGSISKSFTAVATMQLAEEGKLDIDAPVKKYLPWFSMSGDYDVSDMTIRHLLVQTSGIPNLAGVEMLTEDRTRTLEEEVRALSSVPLESAPGDKHIYSNSNYLILGLIIDQISDQGYAGHIHRHIFEPLQMNNSYLSKTEGKAGGMAAGHVKWLGFPFATDVQYLDNSLAAGFIISSVEDMSRYLLMHMNNGQFANQSIVSEGGATELQQPGTVKEGNSDYAMGLVNLSLDDLDLIGHDGSTQGFNAGMAFAPENQWGVVVLTNTSAQLELPAFPLVLGVMELIRTGEAQPLPRTWVVIYFALLILIITLLILNIRSLIQLPKRWPEKLDEKQPRGAFSILKVVAFPVIANLIFPLLVFIVIPAGAGFPVWSLFALFHPDLVYGLLILAALTLIKAFWRAYLVAKYVAAKQ